MRRRGVTLIELMVIVGVIGVVMALILPALQKARENARRSQCMNYLKLIGLALHNYHSANGVLPPGLIRSQWNGEGRHVSAFAMMIVYMDSTALYNSINFSLNPDVDPADRPQPENTTAFNTNVSYLLCPSDTTPFAAGRGGPNSYLLSTGNRYPISTANPSKTPIDGTFYENSALTFAMITDGLSTTALASETLRSAPTGPPTWDGFAPIDAMVLTRGNDDRTVGPELVNRAGQCSGAGLLIDRGRGYGWMFGAPGSTLYNHARTPNDRGVDCRGGMPQSSRTTVDWDALSHDLTARSRHIGGVNVLFADGSVRFLTDIVSPAVWQLHGSANGGEVISDCGP